MGDPGRWLCSLCGGDATKYRPARRRLPLVALPCGHENPDGLWWAPSHGRMNELTERQQANQRAWKQGVKKWRMEQVLA